MYILRMYDVSYIVHNTYITSCCVYIRILHVYAYVYVDVYVYVYLYLYKYAHASAYIGMYRCRCVLYSIHIYI